MTLKSQKLRIFNWIVNYFTVPICEVSSVERLSKETDEDNNSSNVNDSRNINELNNDIVYPLVAEPICVGTVVEQVT